MDGTSQVAAAVDTPAAAAAEEGVPPAAVAEVKEQEEPEPEPAAAAEPEPAAAAEPEPESVEAGPLVTGAETQVPITSSTFDLGAALLKEAEALEGGWKILKENKCEFCTHMALHSGRRKHARAAAVVH
jgi:hypothetical protein